MDDELNFQEKMILEIMQKHYQETIDTFNSIDTKAQGIISASSIAASLLTGFKLAGSNPVPDYVLIGILVSFGFTLGLCVIILFPRPFTHHPIEVKWDSISDALNTDPKQLYYEMLSTYEDAINSNRAINNNKSTLVGWAFFVFSLTIWAAFIVALIQPTLPTS